MALNPCSECGNMVSDSASYCPKCGNNLNLSKTKQPIQNSNIGQNNMSNKKPSGCLTLGAILLAIGFIVFIIMIISDCSGDANKTDTETNNLIESPTKKKTEEELAQENLKLIEKEIASIKKGTDFNQFRGSITQLQLELVMFGVWAKIIDESEIYDGNKIKANELKKLVEEIQRKEFPILRKEYAKESNKVMWEHDIDITSSSNHTILNITGGVFAANKNIKEFNDNIITPVNEFRFKQVRYRWYKNADEFTYYDIYKGKDTDLISF